ncbi:MAG TPA: hypothetical protein EYP85_02075 [Armatimonadetes bacterium]|nr:hypothetical protein [Armatimonadota bacterium]
MRLKKTVGYAVWTALVGIIGVGCGGVPTNPTRSYRSSFSRSTWQIRENEPPPSLRPSALAAPKSPSPGILAVRVEGERAYGLTSRGLLVLKVTDPQKPEPLCHYELPGPPQHLAVAGPRVLVACGAKGLRIVNLSDPKRPRGEGTFAPRRETVRAVAVKGKWAYLLTAKAGLTCLEVSDPAKPQPRATLEEVRGGEGLVLAGERLYVWGEKLVVVDISDPAKPQTLAQLQPQMPLRGLALWRTQVLTLTSQSLALMDFTDPAKPQLVTQFRSSASSDLPPSPATAKQPQRGHPDAGEGPAVESDGCIYFFSRPTSTFTSPREEPPAPATGPPEKSAGEFTSLAVAGDLVALARGREGIWLLSLAEEATPQKVASLTDVGEAGDCALAGERLYVADATGALHIFAVTQPQEPQRLGVYRLTAAD